MTPPLARGGASQARLLMKHRAAVTRPGATALDRYGQPSYDETPDTLYVALPCHAWSPSDVREVLDTDSQGVLGAVRLVVPLGTNIDERCTITSIVDRAGRSVYPGPLTVTAVTPSGDTLAIMARSVTAGGV